MSVGSTNFPGSLDTALDLVEVANKASTTVSGGTLSSGNTTVTVASTSTFTSSGIIGIDDELIAYTGKTATTFTGCTRAFESTTAASHADGAAVKQYITAASHNVQSAAIIAIETKVGSGSSTPAVNTVLAGNGTGTSGWAQVATAMVADAAITYAKIQNVTSGRLLGRSTAGAGAVEEITIGSGLTLSAGTLSASGGGSGTVTNVSVQTANGISGTVANATTAPVITLTLGAITPSTVNGLTLTAGATGWTIAGGTTSKTLTLSNTLTLAGTDGSTLNVGAGGTLGTAAFTAASAYAAAGAVTSSGLTMATARLLGRSTASTGAVEEITIGSGLTLSAGTLSASGGGGGGTPGGSTGDYQINGGSSTFVAGVLAESAGRLTATPTASTTGSTRYLRVLTPADTALTASTEAIGIQFGGNTSVATVTRQFSAGALTAQREYLFVPPTYSFTSASTITTAATVAIGSSSGFNGSSGMPVAGTNATITNPIALFVDGLLNVGTTNTLDPILNTNMTGANIAMNTSGTVRFFVGSRPSTDTWCGVQGFLGIWMIQHNAGPGFHVGTYGSTAWGLMTNNTTRIAIATDADGGAVGINKSSGYGGQLHVVSGSASRVALRADSAAAPTTDIAQFTVNGTLGVAVNKDARIILAERSSNPTGADLTSGGNAINRAAIYMINDKIVFAMNNGSGSVNYLSIPIDGSTTAWAVGAP